MNREHFFRMVASFLLLLSVQLLAEKKAPASSNISKSKKEQREKISREAAEQQGVAQENKENKRDKKDKESKEDKETNWASSESRALAEEKGEKGKEQREREKKEEKKIAQSHFYSKAEVFLGDGRNLKGHLNLKTPVEMTLYHFSNDVRYQKVIRMKDISLVQFRSWQGEKLRKNKVGQIYRFNVASYTITLENGQVLTIQGDIFSFLKEFQLENANGMVKLFSFWIDLHKKDGSWYTKIPGPEKNGRRFTCHPDVVKSISFTNVDSSSEKQNPLPETSG